MAQDYRLTALERQIANRSTREYAKLGKGLSRGMRGLSARGLIGSSEQEQLLADIAERKAQVESESTAARDMLRDQVKQEEEAKAGANLRNAFSIGGTLMGVAASFIPGGGLVAEGLKRAAPLLGSAAGKMAGGATTGTWDPTAANDFVDAAGSYNQIDPVAQLDKYLNVIQARFPDGSSHSFERDLLQWGLGNAMMGQNASYGMDPDMLKRLESYGGRDVYDRIFNFGVDVTGQEGNG